MSKFYVHLTSYQVTKEKDAVFGFWKDYHYVEYQISHPDGRRSDWHSELDGPLCLDDLRDFIKKSHEIDLSFVCLDCQINTSHINEYYMVHDSIWLEAHPDDKGMLCIGCLEERLGRMLTVDDFTDAPVNSIFNKSERLVERLDTRPVTG